MITRTGLAKYWLRVLIELRNRGVRDVCIVVCDGLKGPARRDRPDLAGRDHPDVYRPLSRGRGYADAGCSGAGQWR